MIKKHVMMRSKYFMPAGIDVVAFSEEKLFKQSLFTSSVFFFVLYFVMPNYFQIFNET